MPANRNCIHHAALFQASPLGTGSLASAAAWDPRDSASLGQAERSWPLLTQGSAPAGSCSKTFNLAEHTLRRSREEMLQLC